MKNRKSNYIVGVVVLTLVFSVGFYYYNKWRKLPKTNPHPSHFLQLSGTVNPKLRLRLSAVYYTQNPSCLVTSNWLEGVTDPAVSMFYYPVTSNLKTGAFKLSLPTDQLKRGYCNWRLAYINYDVSLKKRPFNSGDDIIADFKQKHIKRHVAVSCVLWDLNNNTKSLTCVRQSKALGLRRDTKRASFVINYRGEHKY